MFLPALRTALQPVHQAASEPQPPAPARPSPLRDHLVAAAETAMLSSLSHALSLRGALAVVGLSSLTGRHALPWRREGDLYRLYLAEVLLRRTTRTRAARAYTALLGRYPTAGSLSTAAPDRLGELLQLHRVGLYSRSEKLIRGAALIHSLDASALARLSRSLLLQKLKGLPLVGNYTADALALHVFGVATLPLDNNASRVLWRALQGKNPPRNFNSVYHDPRLLLLRERLLAYSPPQTARLTHFGVLDVGWSYCRPTRPKCTLCPLAPLCAYALNR